MKSVAETTLSWGKQRQFSIRYDAKTGSTSDNAKADAVDTAEDFCVYLTSHQTAGRGRGTNHWLDTGAGESLLSTWCFKVSSPPQPITSPRIGLALYQAVVHTWPSLRWSLKAPNDLYLNGTKVAGLLVESVTVGQNHRLLVGLGFNILNHPRSLSTATHLTAGLEQPLEEGEWFQFLDEWKQQLSLAINDCLRSTLTDLACQELKTALNANSTCPYVVDKVTPQGDLIHKGGTVRWTQI